ncbi:MAG: hypothetical protein R8F63_12305 [Acidimicrobiales bacterium]|nr:hypothetical protein [Acidimicrobiales bacterium]
MTPRDPILEQRAKARRIVDVGQRLGYALYGVAIVAFVIGMLTDFTGIVAGVALFGLIAGSVVLAPAIIGGYAIKAAVRDDLEHGRNIGD